MTFFGANLLTAIATVVLAVLAIVTAWYARRAFLKQSQEVRAIEQQVSDQKELTAKQADLLKVQSDQLDLQRRQFEQQDADRRRAQASRVFVWQNRNSDIRLGQAQAAARATRGEQITIHVKNTSDQPVYDPEIRWHLGSPANHLGSTPLPVLLPGENAGASHDLPQENPGLLGATLRFRDANQVRWSRYPDGQLFEE